MSGKNRTRKHLINFYINDIENEIIKAKLKKSGIKNRSTYLRKMATQGTIVKIDMEGINNLVYEINKIGVNINQIAKKVNESNTIYKNEIEEIQEKINDIWDKIADNF